MSNIERYVADQTEGGDEMVLDTSRDPARVVCMCRTDEDADTIARALNNQGAVDLLREVDDGWDRLIETDDLDAMTGVVAKVRAFLARQRGQ